MISLIKSLLGRLYVLLLLMGSVTTVWACFPDINNHIEVSPFGECSDIQAAINIADGFNQLTVDVLAGDYMLSAPLLLKSNVQLLGAGSSTTTLRSTRALIHLIEITNIDNVTVSGFSLKTGGFLAKESSNITITQNTVDNTQYGVLGYTITDFTVSNNNFIQNEFGLVIDETEPLFIVDNIIDAGPLRQRDGMHLWQNLATITGNTIQGNIETGIEFGYGDYTITGNSITLADCSDMAIHAHENNNKLTPSIKNISANTTTCG